MRRSLQYLLLLLRLRHHSWRHLSRIRSHHLSHNLRSSHLPLLLLPPSSNRLSAQSSRLIKYPSISLIAIPHILVPHLLDLPLLPLYLRLQNLILPHQALHLVPVLPNLLKRAPLKRILEQLRLEVENVPLVLLDLALVAVPWRLVER